MSKGPTNFATLVKLAPKINKKIVIAHRWEVVYKVAPAQSQATMSY